MNSARMESHGGEGGCPCPRAWQTPLLRKKERKGKKMKKLIALILAVVLLCASAASLAEEGQMAPLYPTVGEAMKSNPDRVVAGGIPGEYYAVVTEKDGKYYRSVALYDEKLNQMNAELDGLDYEAEDFFEKHEALMTAIDEYIRTLPIAWSEEFTASPLTGEEMEAWPGKTLDQMTEAGFEIGSNGTEPGEKEDEILIVYTLRQGVFDYRCLVDADFDSYQAAQENGTEGNLVVKKMELAGITEWGFDRRFHTDGTVEEPADPFAEFGEIITEMLDLIQKEMNGEKIDMDAAAQTLKEKYPNSAEMIDMYVNLYKTMGAETLASLLTPAETEEPAETAEPTGSAEPAELAESAK